MRSIATSLVLLLCLSQVAFSEWYFRGGFTTRQQPGLYIADPQAQGMSGYPGARQQMAGVFAEGELWLYGGYGVTRRSNQIGYAGDLWSYNPSTTFWTFESGSQEIQTIGRYGALGQASVGFLPGARRNLDIFYNSNRNLIYLFGGQGRGVTNEVGELNEMWTYNIATKEWAWISGSSMVFAPAVLGEPGDCAPGLVPGGRYGYSSGYDSECEKFYIFGGWGVDSNGLTGYLSDVWAYDVPSNRWAHLGGQTIRYRQGIYPAGGVGSGPGGSPGSRRYSVGFLDAYRGHFYMGFGQGLPLWSLGSVTTADFWRFDVVTREFTWISGVSSAYFMGDAANPRSRFTAQNWYDSSSNTFYMYGGISHLEEGGNTLLGDLWEFDVETQTWSQTTFGGNDRRSVNVGCGVGCMGAVPGSRFLQNVGGVDEDTNTAYMYGGYGPDIQGRSGYISEFWSYDLNDPRMIVADGYECAAVTDSCYLDPTAAPSAAPSASPIAEPSASPSSTPSSSPTRTPVPEPSAEPSKAPSTMPSSPPSNLPSTSPTAFPSSSPSLTPTSSPSVSPTRSPITEPSSSPSTAPSESPSSNPSTAPSSAPSTAPTVTQCGPYQREVRYVASTEFGVCQNYYSLTRIYADQAVEVSAGPLTQDFELSICMACGTYVLQVFHSCDSLYRGYYTAFVEQVPVAFDALFTHASARVFKVDGCNIDYDPYQCNYGKEPITVQFAPDTYPEDIRFSVFSEVDGESVLFGGYEGGQTCVDPGYYAFQVVDYRDNGICCSYGDGAYFLAAGHEIVASRSGDYGLQDTVFFKVAEKYSPMPSPTSLPPYPMGFEIHEDAPQSLKDYLESLK